MASFTAPATVLGGNDVVYSQGYWSVGLRAGLDSTWNFSDHFGLYVNTAVSALWGQFKAKARSFDTNTAKGTSDVLVAQQTNNLHTVNPVLQIEGGAADRLDLVR